MYWRGKRNKTAEYVAYQNEIRDQLMDVSWPFASEFVCFEIEAAFSNRAADLDNIMKPILDTYQQTFEEFNDNKVYKINANKRIVGKGDEYLRVRVYQVDEQEERHEDLGKEK